MNALLHAVFYFGEAVGDKFKRSAAGKILDGEYGLEDRLQAYFGSLFGRYVHLQESVVGLALDADQVRYFDNLGNFAEIFSDAFFG
jgi:hypothetical protein